MDIRTFTNSLFNYCHVLWQFDIPRLHACLQPEHLADRCLDSSPGLDTYCCTCWRHAHTDVPAETLGKMGTRATFDDKIIPRHYFHFTLYTVIIWNVVCTLTDGYTGQVASIQSLVGPARVWHWLGSYNIIVMFNERIVRWSAFMCSCWPCRPCLSTCM